MKDLLLVGLGGCVGSIARFKVGEAFLRLGATSVVCNGTVAVNCIGCLCIGLLYGMNERFHSPGYDLRLLLVTGLLGGFTTFSAFGVETVMLYRNGQALLAGAYILTSVLCGLIAVALGMRLGTWFPLNLGA